MKVSGLSNSLSEEGVCARVRVCVAECGCMQSDRAGAGKLNHPVSKRT